MGASDVQHLADDHCRLLREVNALVKAAKLSGEAQAIVPVAQLNRVSRELRGESQSAAFMSS